MVSTPDPELSVKRRLGRFDINEAVVDDMPLSTEIFRQLGFVPWNVQYDGQRGNFQMLGTSPGFREITSDEPAPYYDILVRTEGPDPEKDAPDAPTRVIVTLREQVVEEIQPELTEDSKVAGNG